MSIVYFCNGPTVMAIMQVLLPAYFKHENEAWWWDRGSEKLFIYTLCIMPRSRTGPGNESHQNKAGWLRFAF